MATTQGCVEPSFVGGDLEGAFERLESFVRDAGRRASRPPGAIVHRWTAAGEREVDIFVPLRGALTAPPPFSVGVLPACRVASIIHRGPYDGLLAVRDSLAAWVERAGYRQAGPIRILYLQFGAERTLRLPPGYLVAEQSDYVTELQQPVA